MVILKNEDCLNEMRKLKNSCIDLIVTDPPYGVNYKNNIYDDSEEIIISKMPFWFSEWFRILKDDSYLFIFVGVKTLHKWIETGISFGFNYKNIIATRSFNNGSVTPNNNFGFQFQPIIVFSKGKGKKFNEVDFIPTSREWYNDKRNKQPKPFTYKYPNFIKTEWAYATAKTSCNAYHPNEKNVQLIKFLIEIASKENEVVLDCFLGSGSTGVAAILSNRIFYGYDIDENCFEISKKRIMNCLSTVNK